MDFEYSGKTGFCLNFDENRFITSTVLPRTTSNEEPSQFGVFWGCKLVSSCAILMNCGAFFIAHTAVHNTPKLTI